MKKILVSTLIIGSFSTMLFADAAALYKRCGTCHGANGEKAALGGKSKIIKDMTKADFLASLKGYKNGTYGGAMKGMMVGQVRNLSDADMEAIANLIGK